MAKVVWTDTALRDFQNLLEYIESSAPMAARRLGQKMVEKIDLLEQHPLMGTLIPEDEGGHYRQVLQGNYRIIYRFDGEAVYLIAFYHAARLLDAEGLE